MAKRIIVLEKLDTAKFRILYWADVPATRQNFYAKPGAVSKWPDASSLENAAIESGAITEKDETFSAEGNPGLPAIQAALEARYAAIQAEVNAYNPWTRYGSFFDDVGGWSMTGVS